MKVKKQIVSLLVAIAVLSTMCIPSFAICVSQESIVTNNVVRNIENSISNTTAVLSNGEEILELYPIRVETLKTGNGLYATESEYTLELRDGSGSLSEDDTDIVSTATVVVTIYFDTMTMWNVDYLKLTRFSVDITWNDPHIVLNGLSCLYVSTGIEPYGDVIINEQTKEHEFTIGGHQYVLNTGFTHFTAPEEAYFSLGCTATATFQRGEASFWDFSVQCNYK